MPADRTAPVITLYGRTYCHLCDEMIAALRKLQASHRFDLRILDVDAERNLEQRYGERVPVLVHGDRELCHYRLDASAVTDYLVKIG